MAFTNFSNSPQQDVLPQATKPSTLFSARNLSKGFTPSRCVSCEPRKTPSSLTTPRRNPRTPLAKNAPLCDRFIPVRKGVDHELNSYTLLESLTDGGKEEEAPDEMKSEFQKHVEKELLVKPDKILSFRTKPPKCEGLVCQLVTCHLSIGHVASNYLVCVFSNTALHWFD